MKRTSLLSYKALLWLVAVNVVASILHYVDNVMFFHEYPEPPWLTPAAVDAFWFVMTPVALLGLWLVRQNHLGAGLVALTTYAGMSLLVLGHYNFAPFHAITWRIHLFIWLEAAAAITLFGWVIAAWNAPRRLSST